MPTVVDGEPVFTTLKLYYDLETYTVTYTDGVDGSVFENQVYEGVKHGAPTPAFVAGDGTSTPTRDGYEFAGWEPTVADTVTSDAIYEAQWTQLFTVKFDLNNEDAEAGVETGEVPQPANQSVKAGDTATAPDTLIPDVSTFTDDQDRTVTFCGWYTADGALYDFDTPVTEDITLYAHWSVESTTMNPETFYEVEYYFEDLNGAYVLDETKTERLTAQLGSTATVTPDSFEGFTFNSGASVVSQEVEMPTVVDDEPVFTTLKLYYDRNSYTLTYVTNGGTIDAGASYTAAGSVAYGTPIDAPSADEIARDGYYFSGWYQDASLDTPWNGGEMPAQDLTLYAAWSKVKVVTLQIPFEKEVRRTGVMPGEATFEFTVYNFVNADVSKAVTVSGARIVTEGVGTYRGTLTIHVPEDKLAALEEGFYVKELAGSSKYWDYSSSVYRVEPEFTKLADGTYTASADVYYGDTSRLASTMTFVNTYHRERPIEEPDSWTLGLKKVDAEDATTLLAGAQFELYRSGLRTDTLIGTYITDSKGEIQVTVTESGEYYWVEIKSPTGYTLDATRHYVNTSWNGGSVVVENEKTETPSALNDDDHFAYVIGYSDGLVHPEANITRAEVATIFFRLLDEDIRNEYMTKNNSFPDVNRDDWFNTAVSTMSALGIINGYPDGTFGPYDPISRAEFAAIAARFDSAAADQMANFTDIDGHWAVLEISKAAQNGWVNGYTDGTFKPDQDITRAEAMALINRVLNRNPREVSDLLPDMIIWPDNLDTKKWYYFDVQEATNSHDYERKQDHTEKWTYLRKAPDWAALEL